MPEQENVYSYAQIANFIHNGFKLDGVNSFFMRPRIGVFGSVTSVIASGLVSLMTGDDSTLADSEQSSKNNILYDTILDELSQFYDDSIYFQWLRSITKTYPNELIVCSHLIFYVCITLFCKRMWNYFWRLVKFIAN